MNSPETDRQRSLRLTAESANAAHEDGRHGPGAVLADRKAWAALGCRECIKSIAGLPR